MIAFIAEWKAINWSLSKCNTKVKLKENKQETVKHMPCTESNPPLIFIWVRVKDKPLGIRWLPSILPKFKP